MIKRVLAWFMVGTAGYLAFDTRGACTLWALGCAIAAVTSAASVYKNRN